MIDYTLWRLRLPAGRMIGDNNCRYDNFQALALALRTRGGLGICGFAGNGAICEGGLVSAPDRAVGGIAGGIFGDVLAGTAEQNPGRNHGSAVRGISLIFGNSPFEISVHAACAYPGVDRFEYSGLAWNDLIAEPVRFERGYAMAPTRPGHGFTPDLEALKAFSEDCE